MAVPTKDPAPQLLDGTNHQAGKLSQDEIQAVRIHCGLNTITDVVWELLAVHLCSLAVTVLTNDPASQFIDGINHQAREISRENIQAVRIHCG